MQHPVKKPNAEESASFISKLFFFWLDGLLKAGIETSRTKGGLDQEDLNLVAKCDVTSKVYKEFEHHWKAEEKLQKLTKGDQVHVMQVFKRCFGRKMVFAGCLKLFNDYVQFTSPIVLSFLIATLEHPERYPSYWGYMLAGILFVISSVKGLVENRYFFICSRIGLNLRSALIVKIYEKALGLSSGARQTKTTGEIVNYMQLDVSKLQFFLFFAHQIWSGPHQIIGCLLLLYLFIGWPAFVGFGSMLVLIPFQGYIQGKIRKFKERINGITDSRVKITNEVLQGIKTIKMTNWEDQFLQTISGTELNPGLRTREMSQLSKKCMVEAVNGALFMSGPAIVAVVTFITYASTGGEMTPSKIFTALALFSFLRIPLFMIPQTLSLWEGVKLSLVRLDGFLNLSEVCARNEYFQSSPVSPYHHNNDDGEHSRSNDDDDDEKKKLVAVGSSSSSSGEIELPQLALPSPPSLPAGSCIISNGHFSWSSSSSGLSGINLNIYPGSLVAIVGKVGSGKTTLLNALLGETIKVTSSSSSSGIVSISGSVGYCCQSPWILNASISDNITMKAMMDVEVDDEWYQAVISAVCLNDDLGTMPKGSATEIGERGINLSGGQKARVSIARMMYSYPDVMMMDDSLSALDAETSRKVFENCLLRPPHKETSKRKSQTRILVTNQLHVLPLCDVVVYIDDGEVMFQGSFNELMKFDSTAVSGNDDDDDRSMMMMRKSIEFAKVLTASGMKSTDDDDDDKKMMKSTASATNPSSSSSVDTKSSSSGKTVVEEERQKGSVKSSVYLTYINSANALILLISATTMTCLQHVSSRMHEWWLSYWSDHVDESPLEFFVVIFALLAVLIALFSAGRSFSFAIIGIRSSTNLHTTMLKSVLNAPLAWFDVTPTGRIINRFSQDLNLMDEQLPELFGSMANMIASVVIMFLTIAFVSPVNIIALVPIAIMYVRIMNYFRATQRELKRLDAVSKSPIYSNFSQSLGGLSTIRAYCLGDAFSSQIAHQVDVNHEPYFSMKAMDRWLSIRLETLGNLIVLSNALVLVYQCSRGTISPALAGFSLAISSYAAMLLNWCVRVLADLEALMNAVERILHFSNQIPQERQIIVLPDDAHKRIESTLTKQDESIVVMDGGIVVFPLPTLAQLSRAEAGVPRSWPSKGQVKFDRFSLRYRSGLDVAVSNISFSIQAGERIGIVGRTGSGKSSILLGLLRLVEGSAVNVFPGTAMRLFNDDDDESGTGSRLSGRILIDDVDISQVPLSRLRKHVAIIPQDSVMFSGSFRSNLDPFDEYSDGDLWAVLGKVGLNEFVRKLIVAADGDGVNPASTTTASERARSSSDSTIKSSSSSSSLSLITVSEFGTNFSQGQRQLVCLARALLRTSSSSVFLLDEATASIDYESDRKIQQVLCSCLSGCTILTIAHRLDTIIDSDRVLVLDRGQVAQFDEPHVLLSSSGIFDSLVNETGVDVSRSLRAAAEESFKSRRKSRGDDN